MVFLASFLIKFDDDNLKFDVSYYGYPMRIQSRFSQELLQLFVYICIDERMKLHLFENEIKYKAIQKMRV